MRALFFCLCLVACDSAHDGPVDLSATVDQTAVSDGGVDAPSYGGDRNLGGAHPYPQSVFIQNGGRFYDVTHPPGTRTAAKGDGTTDDTAAFQDAFDFLRDAFVAPADQNPIAGYDTSTYFIYVPDGTYRVTDTLFYRGAAIQPKTPMSWYGLVRIRILGESREHTVIRLDDALPAFQDASNPKVLLAYQHSEQPFNNWPADNVLSNLTLSVGAKNPGAVGVFFQGANASSMTNVRVRSEDGAGRYGIWLKIGSQQSYNHDLTVEGFDYGIALTINSEANPSFEHVTLRGQHTAALLTTGGQLIVRDVYADETATGAGGLVANDHAAQVVVLDSHFVGTGGVALDDQVTSGSILYVRNLSTVGYGDGGVDTVSELVQPAPVVAFAGTTPTSLALPIEDTPLVAWGDPLTEWANVDDYGAKGDGTTDDSVAVQAALDSGRPVVYFPKATYRLASTVNVPVTVLRIDGMYADVSAKSFSITEASTSPLDIEQMHTNAAWTITKQRPLALRLCDGNIVSTVGAGEKVWVENVGMGAGDSFDPTMQTLWARGIDNENVSGNGDITVLGGTMWIFDFKTENKPVSTLYATNGAHVEVLGGYVNITQDPGATPMIVNQGSDVSFTGVTSSVSGKTFATAVTETKGTATKTLASTDFPTRAGNANSYLVPLYVGRSAP